MHILFRKKIKHKIKAHKQISSLIVFSYIFISLFIIHTVVFKYLEKSSWLIAIYETWQVATTVGYGTGTAQSSHGIIMTMIIGTLNIAFLGTLISTGFETKKYIDERKRLGLSNNIKIKDGYIIVNFPGEKEIKNLINGIRVREPNVPFLIIDEALERLPEQIEIIPNIKFKSSPILLIDTYKKISYEKNLNILIYPKDCESSSSDAITSTIANILTKDKAEDTLPRIICILVDYKNKELIPKNVFIIPRNFWVLVAIQECQDPYTSKVMEHILTNDDEITITVKPKKIVGMTWNEFLFKCLAIDGPRIIALVRDGIPRSKPKNNPIINKYDLISLVDDINFNWNNFEKKLLNI